MGPINLPSRGTLLALAAAAGAAAGWWAHSVWDDARRAQKLEASINGLQDRLTADGRKSAAAEAELERLRSHNRELTRRLAHETTKPDYRCPLPADGVRLRSTAISGDTAGEPDAGVRGDSGHKAR